MDLPAGNVSTSQIQLRSSSDVATSYLETAEPAADSTIRKPEPTAKPVSSTKTIFNICCSAMGLGAFFVPTTMCGTGLPLGIVMIICIGAVSHWTSCALVDATEKSESKSLPQMLHKVLGYRWKMAFNACLFVLLSGAVGVYILLMAVFTLALFWKPGTEPVNFRVVVLMFVAGPCLLLLLVNNLKVLSYVSLAKVLVIVVALFVCIGHSFKEASYRRDFVDNFQQNAEPSTALRVTEATVYPLIPTIFGLMKGLSSWQASFIFHIGANDMYTALKQKSLARWRRCSLLGVCSVGIVTIGYALCGYLSTANQKMLEIPSEERPKTQFDLCTGNHGQVFWQLFEQTPAIQTLSAILIVVMVLSYPLYFFFLKNYVIGFWKELFPECFERYEQKRIELVASALVWSLTLAFALIDDNPFKVLDFCTSFLSSIAVYLLPTWAWMRVHGGVAHVVTLGYLPFQSWSSQMQNQVESDAKQLDPETRQQNDAGITDEMQTEIAAKQKDSKASRLSLLSASLVLSAATVILLNGAAVSVLNFSLPESVQNSDRFPWRIDGFDFNAAKD